MFPCVALFHGNPLILLVPVIAFVLLAFLGVVVFAVWWRFTKLSPLYLSVAYFVVVAILASPAAFIDPTSNLVMAVLAGFILTLPWSGLAYWALPSAGPTAEFAGLIVGVVINTAIIFGLGRLARYVTTRVRESRVRLP